MAISALPAVSVYAAPLVAAPGGRAPGDAAAAATAASTSAATSATSAPSATPAAGKPAAASAVASAIKPVAKASSTTELSPEALVLIDKLKSRDTVVRQHEQAHLAAAGGLALSGATYTYERGPNGVSYAIGGEVQIDTSPGRTPEETIAKARTVAAAALAPADPSGADRAVAAQAAQLEQQAQAELAIEQANGTSPDGGDGDKTGSIGKAGNADKQASTGQADKAKGSPTVSQADNANQTAPFSKPDDTASAAKAADSKRNALQRAYGQDSAATRLINLTA